MDPKEAPAPTPDPKQIEKGKDSLLRELKAHVTSTVADMVEVRLGKLAEELKSKATEHGRSILSAGGSRSAARNAVTQLATVTGCVMLALATAQYTARTGGGKQLTPLDVAEKNWPNNETVEKALQSNDFAAGGALVDDGYRSELIDLLTLRVAVRRLGPQIVPMPEGSMSIGKVTSDVTSNYEGESAPMSASQPTTGRVQLVAKKLTTLVPISNSYIRRAAAGRSSLSVETMVQNLAVRRQGLKEDIIFIRGDGAENTPKGLRSLAASGNILPANGTVSFANTLADLGRLLNALEGVDVPMIRPGWAMSPRTKNYLMFQALSGADETYPFFLQMMRAGELLGFPFAATSQIPNTLGSGTDESEIYLADFDQVLLGETLDMTISTSAEAAYRENGTLVSAYERDETLMRLISEHDLQVEHSEAVVVLNEVTWGDA